MLYIYAAMKTQVVLRIQVGGPHSLEMVINET